MYAWWFVWAFIVGIDTTKCSDDWFTPRPARLSFVLKFLFCFFLGVGIPALASLAWSPAEGDLRYPALILGMQGCIFALAAGFLLTLFGQWLFKKMCS